jgi:hypothetical protein
MDLKLAPGVKSDDFNFCLKNTGDVPLDLMASIPAADLVDSPIPAGDVTLDISCEGMGTAKASDVLSGYTGDDMLGTLQAGDDTTCTANATLKADFDGAGTSVKPFTVNFAGTQSTATTEPGTGTGDQGGTGTSGSNGGGTTNPGGTNSGQGGTTPTNPGTGTSSTGGTQQSNSSSSNNVSGQSAAREQ